MELKRYLTIEECLTVIRQHYPSTRNYPGIPTEYGDMFERFEETEEHQRLVAGRKRAGADQETWRTLLERLEARYPDAVRNRALHLPTGGYDGTYEGEIVLPDQLAGVTTDLVFMISFLLPSYVIFTKRFGSSLPLPDAAEADDDAEDADILGRSAELSFVLWPHEVPHAKVIAAEIEATFGCPPFPRWLRTIVVPDVWPEADQCGQGRIVDLLFSRSVPR